MSRETEVAYRRKKVTERDYGALLTDEVWFLKWQADQMFALFRDDFERARRILDVGAGTCWFAAHMKDRYGKDVLSLDLSAEVMSLGQELYGYSGETFVGDVRELLATGARFDLVCCSALLHHVEDLGSFYCDVVNLLCPGGLFVAFNEPRSPLFLPLQYLHGSWFGRSTRAHGILELPRSAREYLNPLPEGVDWFMLVDYAKSRRNYEAVLGRHGGEMYALFVRAKALAWLRTWIFPEAIILALRRRRTLKANADRRSEYLCEA
ncbi:MAG: class I SAM-dependent methyltransferase [Chloroflexota bacterium]